MRTAYERFYEAADGNDVDVSIPLSTLSVLIDSSTIADARKEEIIRMVLEQIMTDRRKTK